MSYADWSREIYECRDIIEEQFFESRDRLPDMSDLVDEAEDEDDGRPDVPEWRDIR